MGEITPSDATPGALLKIAGGALGLTGLFCCLVAAQFILWWLMPALASVFNYGMGLLGLMTLGLAWATADGRVWATVLGSLAAPLIGLLSAGWAAWAVVNLSFTLFMLITPLFAGLATILMPLSISAARKCQKGRALVAQSGTSMFGT